MKKATARRILGVPVEATREEIRNAFGKLALKTHPDKNKQSSSAKWDRLLLAYQTLMNGREAQPQVTPAIEYKPAFRRADSAAQNFWMQEEKKSIPYSLPFLSGPPLGLFRFEDKSFNPPAGAPAFAATDDHFPDEEIPHIIRMCLELSRLIEGRYIRISGDAFPQSHLFLPGLHSLISMGVYTHFFDLFFPPSMHPEFEFYASQFYSEEQKHASIESPNDVLYRSLNLSEDEKVPERFLCPVLSQILTVPVRPGRNLSLGPVEQAALVKCWNINRRHPLDQAEFDLNDLVLDEKLVSEIKEFIDEARKRAPEQKRDEQKTTEQKSPRFTDFLPRDIKVAPMPRMSDRDLVVNSRLRMLVMAGASFYVSRRVFNFSEFWSCVIVGLAMESQSEYNYTFMLRSRLTQQEGRESKVSMPALLQEIFMTTVSRIPGVSEVGAQRVFAIADRLVRIAVHSSLIFSLIDVLPGSILMIMDLMVWHHHLQDLRDDFARIGAGRDHSRATDQTLRDQENKRSTPSPAAHSPGVTPIFGIGRFGVVTAPSRRARFESSCWELFSNAVNRLRPW